MCSKWCIGFAECLPQGSISGKVVVEVGSYNVNGTCRQSIVKQRPKSYIGTDMREGPNVDIVCTGEELPSHFNLESVDLVVCTEVLEHVDKWIQFLQSVWSVLKPGGILLLTTRSPGFPLHNYPADYWRFTFRDMLAIFNVQDILTLTCDPTSDQGVGIIVRKVDGHLYDTQPMSMLTET